MNNCTFAGRIGRDAETRQTNSGTSVTGWSLAVDERRGGEKTTLWVDCSMWGERGEKLAQYLTKGSQVCVTGQVSIRSYEKNGEAKAALSLRVNEITLLGGGEKSGGAKPPQPSVAHGAADIDEDLIPF